MMEVVDLNNWINESTIKTGTTKFCNSTSAVFNAPPCCCISPAFLAQAIEVFP